MATRGKALLKSWFKRGLYPKAEQFADWIDSYWHKDEDKIPIDTIENLPAILNDKYARTDGEELERKHDQLAADFTLHQEENSNEFINVHNNIKELEAEDESIWADIETIHQDVTDLQAADVAIRTDIVDLQDTDKTLQTSLTNAHNDIGVIHDMMKTGATLDEAKTTLLALGANYKDLYAVAGTLKTFLEANDTADTTINTWTEIEKFLQGITDTESLVGLLNTIEQRITEARNLALKDYLPLAGGTVTGTTHFNAGIKTNAIQETVTGQSWNLVDFGITTPGCTTLAAQTGTTYIKSGDTNLLHQRNGMDYAIWDERNDGHGSGLDADLLDGRQGSEYALKTEILSGLALGETASTAYRGDLGKVAYDYSQGKRSKGDLDLALQTEINNKVDTTDVRLSDARPANGGNSKTVGDGTMTIVPFGQNGINFGGTGNYSQIYIGHSATDSKPIPTEFIMGGVSGTATVKAGNFLLGDKQVATTNDLSGYLPVTGGYLSSEEGGVLDLDSNGETHITFKSNGTLKGWVGLRHSSYDISLESNVGSVYLIPAKGHVAIYKDNEIATTNQLPYVFNQPTAPTSGMKKGDIWVKP